MKFSNGSSHDYKKFNPLLLLFRIEGSREESEVAGLFVFSQKFFWHSKPLMRSHSLQDQFFDT